KPGREIIGPPRAQSDIKQATASFRTSSCRVKTDGAALEVTVPGLSMGIFSGGLRVTPYRGTNLLRLDHLATTKEEWLAHKYAEETPQYADNFALFNAPPGTVQRMGVYFYASPDPAEGTRQAVLRFTHGDEFKPLPGYKTFVNHFHLRFTDRVRAQGSFDTPMQDLMAMKALGLNVIGLSDFHGDLHPNDPGPLRFKDQKDYFEATRRASDRDFLVTPWEEPSAFFG